MKSITDRYCLDGPTRRSRLDERVGFNNYPSLRRRRHRGDRTAMKLMLLGATGLVGQNALRLALADTRIDQVIAPTRRPLRQHPKLLAPIVDFEKLDEDANWWSVNAVICALGTTLKTAGSQEGFFRVDHDYPLACARLARRYHAKAFVLNSAIGANETSRFFYNRVKGEVERDVASLDFPSLTIVRPGFIGGERQEFRSGERLALVALGLLGPMLPRAWRINPAGKIAAAMIDAAVTARPGRHTIASADLV